MSVHVPTRQPIPHLPHLHVPAFRIPVPVQTALISIIGLALVVAAFVLLPIVVQSPAERAAAEQRSLIEFRAGERASAVSEAEAIIEFRAGERSGR